MWDDLMNECSCVRVYVQQLRKKTSWRNGFRWTERELAKEIHWRDKKKTIKERRKRKILPLCLGLKLIGPGLEEIIYFFKKIKNTENLYKAPES